VGDTADIVLKDYILLESTAARLGLEVKHSKCENVGHTEKTRQLVTSNAAELPETSLSTVVFLVSPISAGPRLNNDN